MIEFRPAVRATTADRTADRRSGGIAVRGGGR